MRRSFQIFILFLLLVESHALLAQKTDTLFLNNGDRIIGEVKGLKYGKVTYKTSSASTLSIKWDHVDSLISDKHYRIKFENGTEWYGRIDSIANSNILFKLFQGMEDDYYQEHYSELIPVKDTWRSRIDGKLSMGFSYTQASEITNLNLGGNISYRAQRNYIELKYDLITTIEGREDRTNRKQNANFQYIRFLPNHWVSQTFVAYEQNLELALQGRIIGGTTGGYNFFETNHAFWVLSAGPMYSYELSTVETDPTRENWEAIILSQLKLFSFSQPNVQFDLDVSVIPSFTVQDRIRANVETKFKWEIFSDFYWEWSYYYNFDSKPISEEASNSDFGVTTGLSYIF